MHNVLEQVLENGGIFSVAMLDINGLKTVNDTYGHEAGDLLIKNFAEAIRDRLDSDAIFARMGGDEFTIVFPGKDKDYVEKAIEGINAFFAETPFSYCGREIMNITYSCGISTYPEDSKSIDALIRIADSYMYDFKKKQKAAN
jgi:diguanylate cyclase (GGDEF)-like protein